MSDKLQINISAWDIISGAEPLFSAYIDALRKNLIPDNACLTKIQDILISYISELERSEALTEKFGNFSFQNHSRQGTSDDTLIDEVSKKPDAFWILYTAAKKKLISVETDNIPQDTVQWMVRNHYLAPADNHLHNVGKLYGITSKGYYCLTKERIRSKFCKNHPITALPKALHIAPDGWDTFTLYQASLIKRYYAQAGIEDYLIIPARGVKNVLLGCEISPDPEIRYVFAWIDAPTVLEKWKAYVQETLSAQSVSRVTTVCHREETSALQDIVKDLTNADKLQISCLEVSE